MRMQIAKMSEISGKCRKCGLMVFLVVFLDLVTIGCIWAIELHVQGWCIYSQSSDIEFKILFSKKCVHKCSFLQLEKTKTVFCTCDVNIHRHLTYTIGRDRCNCLMLCRCIIWRNTENCIQIYTNVHLNLHGSCKIWF